MNLKGLGDLMKQAQHMQAEMERLQAEVGARQVEGNAGGGLVTVVANGRGEIVSVRIDPEAAAEEREMLQDLIVAAANDALRKARELMTQEMGRMVGGLGLPPGLFRPGGP
jgi:hypothetical protein